MTHGAILLDGDGPLPPGAAIAGCREEITAIRIATEAAKRSSEEKTRRHREGVKVDAGFSFVIIELGTRVWFD
jgi:hypothetical protein